MEKVIATAKRGTRKKSRTIQADRSRAIEATTCARRKRRRTPGRVRTRRPRESRPPVASEKARSPSRRKTGAAADVGERFAGSDEGVHDTFGLGKRRLLHRGDRTGRTHGSPFASDFASGEVQARLCESGQR